MNSNFEHIKKDWDGVFKNAKKSEELIFINYKLSILFCRIATEDLILEMFKNYIDFQYGDIINNLNDILSHKSFHLKLGTSFKIKIKEIIIESNYILDDGEYNSNEGIDKAKTLVNYLFEFTSWIYNQKNSNTSNLIYKFNANLAKNNSEIEEVDERELKLKVIDGSGEVIRKINKIHQKQKDVFLTKLSNNINLITKFIDYNDVNQENIKIIDQINTLTLEKNQNINECIDSVTLVEDDETLLGRVFVNLLIEDKFYHIFNDYILDEDKIEPGFILNYGKYEDDLYYLDLKSKSTTVELPFIDVLTKVNNKLKIVDSLIKIQFGEASSILKYLLLNFKVNHSRYFYATEIVIVKVEKEKKDKKEKKEYEEIKIDVKRLLTLQKNNSLIEEYHHSERVENTYLNGLYNVKLDSDFYMFNLIVYSNHDNFKEMKEISLDEFEGDISNGEWIFIELDKSIIAKAKEVQARFFLAPFILKTWPKIGVLTKDGKFYCEYLNHMKPTIIEEIFDFSLFEESNYKFEDYQPIQEITFEEAISFELEQQENWVLKYLENINI